ncbi:MAG: ATP-binding cassette domain-containing protein [Spirochaetales bacterium]|nr:ATP-binding cassette domain-containing protein [Spirochaetales bacterium]
MAMTTKECIIETALKLIGTESFQSLTVRRIAEEAGVNVAAINYHFGSKEVLIKKAIDSLSFSVEKGEIFGILGPNGAGKTTIIKQIMGLLAPDRGEITVLGFNPQKDWEKMRLYFQEGIATFYGTYYKDIKIVTREYISAPTQVEWVDIIAVGTLLLAFIIGGMFSSLLCGAMILWFFSGGFNTSVPEQPVPPFIFCFVPNSYGLDVMRGILFGSEHLGSLLNHGVLLGMCLVSLSCAVFFYRSRLWKTRRR